MGKPTGFLEINRQDRTYVSPQERLRTWNEFVNPLPGRPGFPLHGLRDSVLPSGLSGE